MAGTLDLHTLLVLKNKWGTYGVADSAAFEALFSNIPATMVTSWHTYLRANQPDFKTSFNHELANIPQVVVSLQDEPVDDIPLGYHGVSGLTEYVSMFVRETVTITVYAPSNDIARALHVMVRASMLSQLKWLIRIGYEDLQYLGGGDLGTDPDLQAEELGVYVRTQRWSSASPVDVTTGTTFNHKNATVNHIDVPGGVKPYSP